MVQPERQRDVLRHRQLRQQVEVLEHEADAAPPQHRLPAVGEPGQVRPAQPHRAGRGTLEPGRALQQRRLARPGDAEYRAERTCPERQRHPVKRRDRAPAAAVALRHVRQRYRGVQGRGRGFFCVLNGLSNHAFQRAVRTRSAQWCRPPGSE